MPALSFRPRFREPILQGRKTHTIRAAVPRGFALGEWCPLYTGLRTKAAAIIGSGRMNRTYPVEIDFKADTVLAGAWLHAAPDALDEFAVSDGFTDWADMRAFWRETHGDGDGFSGHLVGWDRFVAGERRLGLLELGDDPAVMIYPTLTSPPAAPRHLPARKPGGIQANWAAITGRRTDG